MNLPACALVFGFCLVALASARPKYVAIPLLDGVRIVELEEPARRVPREAGGGGGGVDEEGFGSAGRHGRQAGGEGHEHVDYGAHTGHHGAFGWYADFPVHGHS